MSSKEVGSGHVAIFPSFRGVRKGIAKEVNAGVSDAGKSSKRGMARIGQTGGAELGRGLRSALTASAGDLGSGALKTLEKNVATTSRALSTARLKQADDAGRVRVAETKLAEAIAKSGASSSQAIAAEERLASARRRLEVSTASVTRISADLASAQSKLKTAQDAVAAATERASRAASNRGWSAFRRNVSDVLAPVRLLGSSLSSLATRTLAPLTTRLSAFGSAVTARVTNAVRPAALAVRDFGLQVGLRVTSALSSAEKAVTRLFGPALQRLSPLTSAVGRSFSGMGRIIGQSFSGLVGVAGQVASGIGSAFAAGMRVVGRTVSDAVTLARGQLGLLAAGIATTIGAAVGGGFKRLFSIEDATARMRGLGLSSDQVAGALKNAENAAVGTAFGLDEMAGAASMALTAGVKTGPELAAYLESVKGAATAGKVPLSEVAQIFGKVRTSGRAYTMEINQLADRQIPIWGALASRIGVSVDEVRNLASEGKITAEVYEAAVRDATGGMAAEVAQTTTSSYKNAFAALKRFGVALIGTRVEGDKLVGGLFPLLKQFADMVRSAFDAASAVVGPFMAALTDQIAGKIGPVLERLTTMFNGIKESFAGGYEAPDFSNLTGSLGALAPIIGLVVGLFGPLLAQLPVIGRLFLGLTGPVGLAIGALIAVFTIDPTTLASGFETMIPVIVGAITGLVGQVVTLITTLIPQMVSALSAGLPVLLEGFVSLLLAVVDAAVQVLPDLISAVVGLIPVLGTALVGALPIIIAAAITLFTGLIDAVVQILPMLIAMLPQIIEAGLELFSGLITALIEVIPQVVTALVEMLPVILETLIGMLPTLLETAINLFLQLVLAIVQVLPQLITTLVEMLPQIITTLVGMIPTLLLAAVDLFIQLVQAIPVVLPQLLTAIIGMIPQVVTSLISMIPMLITGAVQLFKGIVQALPKIIPELISAILGLGPELVKAIVSLIPQLFDAGKSLIQGLIDGVKDMFGAVGSAFGDMMDFVGGFFPHSPAKRGPLSGSGWRRIREGGQALVDQFSAGVGDSSTAAALSKAVGNAASLTAHVAASQADAVRASASSTSDERAIYVQSPWGPEYMRAQTEEVARGASAEVVSTANTAFRRGGRRR
ncbi:tape measure protein [Microbacterium sp. NPDC089696]|uniref:tape measure protein n=1 Tax=Microbacterium sp. NPDC089696 TaxID=3364199 RepID=UPI0037FFC2EC